MVVAGEQRRSILVEDGGTQLVSVAIGGDADDMLWWWWANSKDQYLLKMVAISWCQWRKAATLMIGYGGGGRTAKINAVATSNKGYHLMSIMNAATVIPDRSNRSLMMLPRHAQNPRISFVSIGKYKDLKTNFMELEKCDRCHRMGHKGKNCSASPVVFLW